MLKSEDFQKPRELFRSSNDGLKKLCMLIDSKRRLKVEISESCICVGRKFLLNLYFKLSRFMQCNVFFFQIRFVTNLKGY